MSVATIEKLIGKSISFHTRAQNFKQRGELEGALINFLLSADNLETALTESQQLPAVIERERGRRSQEVAKWCDEKCSQIRKVLEKLLQEIIPLQEELKKRKSFRISSPSGDDEITNCSNVRQLVLEGSDCLFFDDVIGHQDSKEELRKLFILPLAFPNLYPRRAQGILLYGVAGTGKTSLAKAAASELQVFDDQINVLFFAPTPDRLKGKFVGETEKNIAAFFDCASLKARQCQRNDPSKKVISIIFFDELDSIAPRRGGTGSDANIAASSVNILLQKMQGISTQDNVAVIGVTNFPDLIDPAVLRRFDRRIKVGLPSEEDKIRLVENEIDNYIRLDASRFESNSDTSLLKIQRLTRGSTSLVCEPKCVKPREQRILYTDPEYRHFVSITRADIEAMFRTIADGLVSQSDVTTWARKAFVKVAERAREKGTFAEISLDDVRGKRVQVFMSLNILDTLSSSRINDIEKVKDKFGITDTGLIQKNLIYSSIPDIVKIQTRNLLLPGDKNDVLLPPVAGTQHYYHRIVFKDTDFIINLPIREAYVDRETVGNSTRYQLLIPRIIQINYPEDERDSENVQIYLLTRPLFGSEIEKTVKTARDQLVAEKKVIQQDIFRRIQAPIRRLVGSVEPEIEPVVLDDEIAERMIKIFIEDGTFVRVIEETPSATYFTNQLQKPELRKVLLDREITISEPKKSILQNLNLDNKDNKKSVGGQHTRPFKIDEAGLVPSGQPEMETLIETLRNNRANTFEKKKKLISWAITHEDFDLKIPSTLKNEDIERVDRFEAEAEQA